jgi:hypothetical protein
MRIQFKRRNRILLARAKSDIDQSTTGTNMKRGKASPHMEIMRPNN